MSRRILKTLFHRPFKTTTLHHKCAFSGSAQIPVASEEKDSATALRRKPEKSPFVLNLFAGEFDQDILVYPEYLHVDKLKELEDQVLKVKAYGVDKQSECTRHAVKFYKNLRLSNDNLEELSLTENLRLSEAFSSDPGIALTMEVQNLVVHTIKKFGSENQKNKYLPKLISGELIGAYAVSEGTSGSDPLSIETSAVKDSVSGKWKISGKKLWVTNGNICDCLILFTNSKIVNKLNDEKELCAFILDKNMPGLEFEEQKMSGLLKTNICKISLDNVEVPEENIITESGMGLEILISNFAVPKLFLYSCILENVKLLLKQATEFIKHRKQTVINLRDSEIIKKRMARIASVTYAFESMLYLFAGWTDQYSCDTSLESVVVDIFGKEFGLKAIDDCVSLFGAKGFEESAGLNRLRNDIASMGSFLQTVDLQKLFVALKGFQYAGLRLGEAVKKLRNPLDFPRFAFRKMLNNRRQVQDDPILDLNLYMNLHNSLKPSSDLLEYSVLRFRFAVETLFVRHGAELVHRQTELERMAEAVVDIYAMASVLGRASRAYCTGIRLSDEEVLLARAFCQDAVFRVKTLLNQVIDGVIMSNDMALLKLGSPIFKHDGYFTEHPLSRNIM